jgi:hypothetical protein
MTLIVTTRTKQQEKMVTSFLKSRSIRFHSEAEEDAALAKAMEKGRKSSLLTSKEKASFLKKLKSAK